MTNHEELNKVMRLAMGCCCCTVRNDVRRGYVCKTKGGVGANQSGVSLIEIMITLVIMSVGMLGLAGLQLSSLQNNRDAYSMAIANQVIQDVCERLSIDPATRNGITGDNVTTIIGDAQNCENDAGTAFTNRVSCLVSGVTGGNVRLVRVTAAENPLYVAVTWSDPQATVVGWSGAAADRACGAAVVGTRCAFSVYLP